MIGETTGARTGGSGDRVLFGSVGVWLGDLRRGSREAQEAMADLDRFLATLPGYRPSGSAKTALRAELEGKLFAKLRQAAMKAVYAGANSVKTEAVQLAPVDEGTLRNSASVSQPEVVGAGSDGEIVTADVGFGGQAADYVVVQHEDMTLSHPRGGGPKFLEKALANHRTKFGAIAQRVFNAALASLPKAG